MNTNIKEIANGKKVITIQSEDEATYKDVMLAYIVNNDFDVTPIENFLEDFKKDEYPGYWEELEKTISEKFNLNSISFDCCYIY